MNTLNKIGLLMLTAAAMALGGCQSMSTQRTADLGSLVKNGSGELYVQVMHGWPPSTKSACEKYAAPGDDRCLHQDQFTAVGVNPSSGQFSMKFTMALVPKSEKIEAGDIIKVRIAPGGGLAYFDMVASRGDSADCGWKRGFPSGGGVVCPKFGWDYRTDLAN